MKKKLSTTYAVAFVVLFIAPTILFNLFGSYLDQANFEQRATAEKPVFRLEMLGEYPQSYEAYYNDNLPFRSFMIEANSLVDFYLFHQSPIAKVIVGEDGWLFYNPAGNDGDPMADRNGSNLYSDEQLAQLAGILTSARDTLQEHGKEFVVYIAPNKEGIYDYYLPSRYATRESSTRADQVVEYLWENTDLIVVYPKDAILNAMNANPDRIYYYKTDTHWNPLGAYIGARELLEALDISIPALGELRISTTGTSSGDLANMMGLSKHLKYDDAYSVSGYSGASEIQEFLPAAEEGIDLTVYSTTGEDSRSLFVIRDSFSVAMLPYLTSQFNNSCFVHRSFYTPDLLTQYPSDIVVFQTVERYIDSLFNFTVE